MMTVFYPKIGINNSEFEDYKLLIVENKRIIKFISYKHSRSNWLKFD